MPSKPTFTYKIRKSTASGIYCEIYRDGRQITDQYYLGETWFALWLARRWGKKMVKDQQKYNDFV